MFKFKVSKEFIIQTGALLRRKGDAINNYTRIRGRNQDCPGPTGAYPQPTWAISGEEVVTSMNAKRQKPADSEEVDTDPWGWSPGSWVCRLWGTRALKSLTRERNHRADDFLHGWWERHMQSFRSWGLQGSSVVFNCHFKRLFPAKLYTRAW